MGYEGDNHPKEDSRQRNKGDIPVGCQNRCYQEEEGNPSFVAVQGSSYHSLACWQKVEDTRPSRVWRNSHSEQTKDRAEGGSLGSRAHRFGEDSLGYKTNVRFLFSPSDNPQLLPG